MASADPQRDGLSLNARSNWASLAERLPPGHAVAARPDRWLAQRSLRISLEPLQGCRHVRPSETDPEAVRRVGKDRPRQQQDAGLAHQTLGEAVDRHVCDQAREADAPTPWPDPFEHAGPAREE